ncbi:hypothetical protein HYC85_019427 [Camellia sinensis]|uniref:Pentacotripeptide-repeat region of PRORP domain-containing protein n=1 Tax=Camellia sinensis TaxID=4442 RepID=A0A7J7GNF9_CAMSI|nr:hypothetical protein HYC85_019427 [Camellia sinensis]
MERNNLVLNIVTYNILIDGFCKVKKVDSARAIFNNLSSKGLHPNVRTYNMMIQGLFEEGLLHEAKELFVKMEQNCCLANDVTYNTIIRGFIRQHKCYEALILVQEMVQRGFSADASTFPLIVNILSTKEQDLALQEVIKKFMPKDSLGMQENGWVAVLSTVNSDANNNLAGERERGVDVDKSFMALSFNSSIL